ncbi:PIN domain-containing protein [Pyrobaculum sp.]|uniref:PIN domain-containing protein n=1 Tax=Pyrobaculum sp. TaxID=2004705 RepID=UPI0031655568
MKCLIDTSVLVHSILTGDLSEIKNVEGAVPLVALEEAMYILIRVSAKEAGRGGFYEAKRAFEQGELNLAWRRIRVLNKLAQLLGVVEHKAEDVERAKQIMARYGLLPNDALIAATALRLGYGLLTKDSDFKKVEELTLC